MKTMALVEPGKNASFMVICRTNYFKDIRPADPQAKKTGGYMEAVAMARKYFKEGRQQEFRAYLSETKYSADLWAAHLLLEQGQPDAAMRVECLAVIERYADSPFDVLLARQEQQWLHDYANTRQSA